ncbi:thiamine phosphate synthase, partial [candidate division WOR-3 bacterium]|nr:thiamine phosphate synthase [candidate division WOR-3 bacterium]
MRLPRLYAVTDEKVLPNVRLIQKVADVLEAGVRLLQVRFKKTPAREQLSLGQEIRVLTSKYNALLVVNDSPELAKEIGADGVHLGADDPKVPYARKILGPDAIVGVSCYEDIRLVRQFSPGDVSYIGLSSPYPSSTKHKEVVSLPRFRELVAASRLPCYAIGGITPERAGQMLDAGCHGVAVISA